VPVSLKPSNLKIELKNGLTLVGEDKINHNYALDTIGIKKFLLTLLLLLIQKLSRQFWELMLLLLAQAIFIAALFPTFWCPKLVRPFLKAMPKLFMSRI